MVFDQRTLIDARAPDQAIADEPDDPELLVAYSSIDYEALRSNPRLNQYMAAMTSSASKGLRSARPTSNSLSGRSRTRSTRSWDARESGSARSS